MATERRPTDKRYMTSTDVARKLSVSSRTILVWIGNGSITPTYMTPGGHARFDSAEVDRLLANKPKTPWPRDWPPNTVNPKAIKTDGPPKGIINTRDGVEFTKAKG